MRGRGQGFGRNRARVRREWPRGWMGRPGFWPISEGTGKGREACSAEQKKEKEGVFFSINQKRKRKREKEARDLYGGPNNLN